MIPIGNSSGDASNYTWAWQTTGGAIIGAIVTFCFTHFAERRQKRAKGRDEICLALKNLHAKCKAFYFSPTFDGEMAQEICEDIDWIEETIFRQKIAIDQKDHISFIRTLRSRIAPIGLDDPSQFRPLVPSCDDMRQMASCIREATRWAHDRT